MIIFTAFLDFLQSLSSVSFSAAVLNLTLEFNNKFCAYVSFQLDISYYLVNESIYKLQTQTS